MQRYVQTQGQTGSARRTVNSLGADIQEGHGEAYYAPGHDFISLPAFATFNCADQFYTFTARLAAVPV